MEGRGKNLDSFIANWIVLVTVSLAAVMSPGPDFVMAVRNSVRYSRWAGIFTAIGFALGVAVHVTYCLAGLALVIAQSVVLFNIIKVIGAGYLFYIGYKALRSRGFDGEVAADGAGSGAGMMADMQALRSGFITNLLNPKATLFFLALFTQVIEPDATLLHKLVFGTTNVILTVMWFSVVATVLTTPAVRGAFLRASLWVDRVCGALFIALGVKLAMTRI